ncbi:MAG: siroheme synthase CysG [Parvularculaceae bacterium]
MENFPAFFSLRARLILVIGGGEAAARKARLVAKTPARLRLLAEDISPALHQEFSECAEICARRWRRADFAGAALAFVAVEDDQDASRAAEAARRARVPVNVVDRPDISDFLTPSIIDRGAVTIAIGTGGAAPVIGRDLRARIEALAPQRLGALAQIAAEFRPAVRRSIPVGRRRAFWERVLRGSAGEKALRGDFAGARAALTRALASWRAEHDKKEQGVVHLVGAGPGDPELLTIRALRILQDADILFYDRLVDPRILDLARRDADRVYVGKAKAAHAVPQAEIEARMIAEARAGRQVVRLKGGDPFVFGRGGEELEALRAAGVEAHVTPGISAAVGCAASVGMPLTHRDFAQSVAFVTGHGARGEPDIDWKALGAANQTLAIFMGVGRAGEIAQALLAAGRAPETPVAVVENGARPEEVLVHSRLDRLAESIAAAGIEGPAMIYVGEVARLARSTAERTPRDANFHPYVPTVEAVA